MEGGGGICHSKLNLSCKQGGISILGLATSFCSFLQVMYGEICLVCLFTPSFKPIGATVQYSIRGLASQTIYNRKFLKIMFVYIEAKNRSRLSLSEKEFTTRKHSMGASYRFFVGSNQPSTERRNTKREGELLSASWLTGMRESWSQIRRQQKSSDADNSPRSFEAQKAELVFVNVYGAKESIPRNRIRQLM